MKIERPLNKSHTKSELIATLRPYRTNTAMLTFSNEAGFKELKNCWAFKTENSGFKIIVSLNDTTMNKPIVDSLIEAFKRTFKLKDKVFIITPENRKEVEMVYTAEDLQRQLAEAMKDMEEGRL